MNQIKPPITYEQQIEKLRSRGCHIDDESFCNQILTKINYYRLSAYFLPFKKPDGNYITGTNFTNIYKIYEFDRNMRNILFAAIEEVEIFLRAKFAYYHAHKYGALGYLDINNSSNPHKHKLFIKNIQKEIDKNKNILFVKHHKLKYNNQFPIWVISELFTFGMLSRFFNNISMQDKKHLAREMFNTVPKNIISWLRCCTDLRNICAHYGRLYFRIFSAIPANIQYLDINAVRRLYGAILALKSLYPDSNKWNTEIFPDIKKLINTYSHNINLDHIGFPSDWEIQLKK